eukprot:maker-scaffold_6-augustus-gene-0.57-mRNA-1 protein AED:0.27 eAED:0.27 QI:0/0/0.5/1/0/0/2/40/745
MMRQAGRSLPEYIEISSKSDFFSMCRDPEVASTISLQPLERFDMLDAVIVFSDILVIPQAMGMIVEMHPGIGPVFPNPIDSPDDIKKLNFNPNIEAKLGYIFDAVNLCRQKINGRVPLIGFAGAPLSLALYMIEGGSSKTHAKSKTFIYKYPEALKTLLDAITEILIKYLVGKVLAGAQLLQVFESHARTFTPSILREYSNPYLKRIATAVKSELKKQGLSVPMTVFSLGAHGDGLIEDLDESDYDVVGVHWSLDASEAKKRIKNKSIQGNLDPCILFSGRDVIRKEVREMLEGFQVATNTKYIGNLGHGMMPTHNTNFLARTMPEDPQPQENQENVDQGQNAQTDAPSADKLVSTIEDGMTIESNWTESVERFDELPLSEELLHGIFAYGFEKPSAIQKRAIKPILMGRDTIAQAQSGTGKTGTFAISALQTVDPAIDSCQCLILSPTRELAQQTTNVVTSLAEFMNVKIHACVGGTAVRQDISILQAGVQIVVGTPGRVHDMISRGALDMSKGKLFVLDEADEMLSRGFTAQIQDVFKYLEENMQVALFSATLPQEVLEVSTKFMRNPIRILVKKDELTLDGIKQFFIACEKEEYKFGVLKDLYQTLTITQSIIYCNTRRKVDWLTQAMMEEDYTVSSMHGDMEQKDRELVMKEFRSGSSRVLITTDLLARGIDVQQVSLVINYDLPTNRENYIHRIGRSGRFGRKGVAINFAVENDLRYLQDIQKFYETKIEEMPENVADLV